MDKFAVIVLLLILACQAEGVKFTITDRYHMLIDCGVNSRFTVHYKDQLWFPDTSYIDSGKTKQINNSEEVPQFFTTLRYFPKNEENCYGLALTDKFKYIFRAGFYYANYDGKSQPPVFDLLLGGQIWQIVNSSSSSSSSSSSNVRIFHEVVYRPKNGNITVCLRGRNNGTPFISSLEATSLIFFDSANQQPLYSKMKNGTAYHLLTRLNFGGYQQIIEPSSLDSEEHQNRYWMPQQVPGYENLSFNISRPWLDYENNPPPPVLATAIASRNTSQSIHTSITLPNSNPQSTYIVLYFYQDFNASLNLNVTRYMDIYVDGLVRANVEFDTYSACEVVTLYPILVQDVTNITISAANGTILPPLLNGMEVFIANELDEQSSDANKINSCCFIVVSIFHFFIIVMLIV